ncbi:Rpn family recombination-promoting nuclease/putative transposase [Megasphaera hexanoica]|uniref:Rpn family recombination-promoting nuclease/putative transposase n=1 Tax=uncultured Megasphaera sp. TaxID=165188 RepID=UPI0025AAEF1A|nr:Rpn family recombination-promoting nuclease/putative transposase [uncultured Megasphaera sp.]MDN0046394.1 Rpn family recombination-promoting nuclease/putative transposase [Megasphaera hexanoica]
MKRIKDWEELTIQDNFLFQKVMRNKRLCQYLIKKILQIKIADITYPDTEKTIDIRLDSKSIRLDVYVKDNTGRVFDIEMQCTNEKENGLAKRTRYYQAMIDMDVLEKGDDYSKLNPAYIIFICTFDAFDQGLPMYTFRNRCVEQEGIELNDEATKIFLNSKGDSPTLDPDVRAFLRYVDGKAAEGVFVQEVDKEVRRVKQHDETRREYMTLAMELKRMFAEGEKTGEEKGAKKKETMMILAMLQDGVAKEAIAKYAKVSVEYITELGKKNHLL